MKAMTLKLEVVTPMFLSGADQKAGELRAPSVRGTGARDGPRGEVVIHAESPPPVAGATDREPTMTPRDRRDARPRQ
jgi:hypothetical protein